MKAPAHHGVRAKHASHKHAHKAKHTAKVKKPKRVTTAMVLVGKSPTVTKPRKLSLDGSVALCSARAVAESLRIALSVPVSDEDVLGLYWHTASHPDAGASVLGTLEAASAYGLAGCRPACFSPAAHFPLILGLELPEGPHAVVDDGEHWWSWGEPYDPADFPGAVIEEAWAVRWS